MMEFKIHVVIARPAVFINFSHTPLGARKMCFAHWVNSTMF